MLEYQDRTVQEVAACTCDRCQRRMTPDDLDSEWHEKLSIAYCGGFDSIFGDGCDISIDLCQQCVKETLGTWLRITPGDDWAAPGSVEALKGIVRKPENAVSVENMNPATERLRGTVLRYDDPTDPVWPSAEKGHVNPALRRLQEAMDAKQRREPPPESEASEWVTVFEDIDDEHGYTIKRGVPVWLPKAEYFEFQRLRFGGPRSEYGGPDHAIRVLDVQAKASDVLGDPTVAMQWLLRATPLLDGIRPIDALETEGGHDRVHALLVRLEHGVGT